MNRTGVLIFEMAMRHLLARRRQTVVAVLGVAVGVGFFLAVSAMMVGSQRDFIDRLIDAAPHIIVSDELRSAPPQPGLVAYRAGAVRLRGYRTRNEARGLRGWQLILDVARATPGAIASPSLTGGVTLRLGGRQEALAIVGIEPDLEARISTISERLRVGRLNDLESAQGGLIIGEELAVRLGLNPGDVVAATASTGSTRRLRIVGLFKRGQAGLTDQAGYMLLREAQSLLGRPFIVNRIGIRLADADQAEHVANILERRFGYKAESWQARSADLLSLLVTRNVIMYSVVGAILLVASFGIYTAVSNSVIDKRRDIAILRAIGFSTADLQFLFVIEGLLLATAGVLLGWLLGYGLMSLLGSLRFPIAGDPEHLPLDRGMRQYLIAAGASLLAAMVAAWLPARKTAKVDPVDILRGAA
ncbi:ABC transporter permease [Rhizorhabdus dicambivorans]|uniref:ABC transporter permease n=1 Tax=Rhizorhabdus dicambivorans TaxID=1850238 RepID=A0A2A4FVS5_9SPHN|nr:FtsX-like permease family protein [Rhizorhabdus dicambivorans]ATE63887.1 ABC transporter permease [Rhizorhabdus dicambivorans]PCE41491.1 ABC transporter permease [Rhizorhabdus dicambivorans]